MKQIEEFIDDVYQDAAGNKNEIEELKGEMKVHLVEAAHELMTEGKSEQEAIKIAINRFGGEKEMRFVVSELFKIQKAFGRVVLYIGVAILLLSSAMFGFFLKTGNGRTMEYSDISFEIAKMVEADPEISVPTEANIESLLNEASYIKKMKVYLNGDRENPVYKLDKKTNTAFSLAYSDLYLGNGTGNSFVEIRILDYRDIGFLTLFFGITCFGVLFIIWTIINIYHKRKPYVG